MIKDFDCIATVTLLSTAEGGRQTPALSGYRPNHLVADEMLTSATHEYLDGDAIRPGASGQARITFIAPQAYPGCLWIGRVIRVQEGGKLIGYAKILDIRNKILERRDPEQ